MIYARKLRHYSSRDHFHLANFAPRFRFTVNVEVFSNRILNILERLLNVCSLRMASWQFRATYRNAFVMFDERYVKFSLHGRRLCFAEAAVNGPVLISRG